MNFNQDKFDLVHHTTDGCLISCKTCKTVLAAIEKSTIEGCPVCELREKFISLSIKLNAGG